MNELLIKKLEHEMEKYKGKIRKKGVDYAIDRAYEITVKQEIIDVIMFDIELSKSQEKILLAKNNILSEMYDNWLSCDGSLRGDLQFPVSDSIGAMTEKNKSVKKNNTKIR